MALTYDITALPADLKDAAEWPWTEYVIHTTLIVGLPTVTAANLKEWRVRLMMAAATAQYEPAAEAYEYLARNIDRYVGLRTNAIRQTRAAFMKDFAAWMERKADAMAAADAAA